MRFAPLLALTLAPYFWLQIAHADAMTDARAHYAAINRAQKAYRRVERDLSGQSSEGGTLSVWYQGTQPRKIVAHIYGEMGQNIEKYYFWNGRLFFFYKVEKNYDKTFGKVVRQSETRAYFEKGKLVTLLTDKTVQSLATPAANALAKQIPLGARNLLTLAKSPQSR